MTPAEEIRAAAAKIRTLASEATPAPWTQRWDHQELQVHGPDQEYPYSVVEWTYAVATVEPQATEQRAECDTADADWIATMHPGVGEKLARWLEATVVEVVAAEGTEYALHTGGGMFAGWDAALAVARAINAGGQP